MEKKIMPISPEYGKLDLALWREFQEGLTALLDMPIELYDRQGELLVPPSKESAICKAICGLPKGKPLCREQCLRAISQVLDKGQTYIYKCHSNQYIFAIPVKLDSDYSLVIIGGKVYLEGSEVKEFYEGVEGLGFDPATLERLKAEIKTISPRSIFTLPGIVNNLAVPFLKSLYSKSGRTVSAGAPADKAWLKGFYALEQVYKTIAPILDREELYETILAKSVELVAAERGSLMILDNKSNILSVKAAKGIDRNILGNIKVRVGEGISGTIAAKGSPVIIRNIEDEVPSHKNIARYKTKSFMSIPLKLDNRTIGVINISDKISGEVFSREDMLLLLTFANYASIALERGAYYSMSEELKMLSMTDPLTGLFNRRYFRERLFEEVERVKRHNECFTTFVLDIDDFKYYNDRYGHAAGDEILKRVSRAIRDAVRSMDVVARYGGEEFAVILPHTGKTDSYATAERIRKEIEGLKNSSSIFKEWPTISIGIAEYPKDANTIDDLIDNADRAMYIAKRLGKNRVVVYEK